MSDLTDLGIRAIRDGAPLDDSYVRRGLGALGRRAGLASHGRGRFSGPVGCRLPSVDRAHEDAGALLVHQPGGYVPDLLGGDGLQAAQVAVRAPILGELDAGAGELPRGGL